MNNMLLPKQLSGEGILYPKIKHISQFSPTFMSRRKSQMFGGFYCNLDHEGKIVQCLQGGEV